MCLPWVPQRRVCQRRRWAFLDAIRLCGVEEIVDEVIDAAPEGRETKEQYLARLEAAARSLHGLTAVRAWGGCVRMCKRSWMHAVESRRTIERVMMCGVCSLTVCAL